MKKRLLSLALVLSLCLSSINVFAGEYHTDGNATIEVLAEVQPSWKITIPANLTLSKVTGTRDEYEYEYTINCYGLIADNKAIKVEPATTSFQLTCGSDNVTANITQSKKYFVSESTTGHIPSSDNENVYIAGTESYTDTKGTIKGKVNAKFTKSGTYNGNFTINFSYADVQ